jgi:hypothetical protein
MEVHSSDSEGGPEFIEDNRNFEGFEDSSDEGDQKISAND